MATICESYNPSEADTRRFWDQEGKRDKVELEVPPGFPQRLDSPLAWRGLDIKLKCYQWKLDLVEEEIHAIDSALAIFEASNAELSSLSAATFTLPEDFSQRLRKLSDQLYNGLGFQIIHGLDSSKYNPRQRLIVYAGITAHICPQRGFIDVVAKGVVAHVMNLQSGGYGPKTTAPAFGNIPLSFHTDNCEIMAFYYLETASSGGQTILSSSWQTYNDLAASRPDVIHTLSEPWVLETFKSHDLQPPRHVRLLQKTDSEKLPVLFRFSRYPITGWQRQRHPDVPPPTQRQLEAADAVQFIAMKNSITLPVVKGDMLLVNDMAIFHARHGFQEDNVASNRHLVKMYFRDPEQGWELPSGVEEAWKTTYSPNRPDGTRKETWNIEHEDGLEELSMLNG